MHGVSLNLCIAGVRSIIDSDLAPSPVSGIGEAFLYFIRLSECLPGAHRPGRHCAGSWGQLLFTLSVLMHHEHFYWVPERDTLSHIQSCAMEPLAILTCPPTEHALSCRSVASRR